MVVHLEALNGLVVLNDGIKGTLFQLLPVPTEVVLGVGVEEKQEVFNIRDDLLELKVVSR
jgi:hypothetical protein